MIPNAQVQDPIGPDNNAWLTALATHATLKVACWGDYWGGYRKARERGDYDLALTQERDFQVKSMIPRLTCLDWTESRAPLHPLSVTEQTVLKPYNF